MLWIHSYALRPTATLLAELEAFGVQSWWSRPQLWTAPTVGDHDDVGQAADGHTWLKLVFLANLHKKAHSGEDANDRRVAQHLIEGEALTEPFFDARWTLEDLGPFVTDLDGARDALRTSDLLAVRGPERASGSLQDGTRTIAENWRTHAKEHAAHLERNASFVTATVLGLCNRFDVSRVSLGSGVQGLPLEGRLRDAGVEVVQGAELSVTPQSSRGVGIREIAFRIRSKTGHPRGKVRARGAVLGEAQGDGWALTLEQTLRTDL